VEGLFLVVSLGAITWYWWDTMSCKEIARVAGSNACSKAQVQFLDDTVELKKFWLRRNSNGHLEICRLYFFEFSSDGAHRYQARITMLGKKVYEVEMDAYRIPTDTV